ncbi:ethanolaminephosphotransferase [Ascodesmis nigricans]|uniref:diacylglycerol cholinephosphotransferase n=1 Tax=Ascodesmis nigricans TaxID=341454 RepID=A0A4S2N3N0_9PEZI|nr:ethanolaminephosphotransferase [Ascodesmis nigricans]
MYIRQSRLRNLRAYKYSAEDHSLVSKYILKPFYTKFFIHLFPMSMAPNLITLTGFSFVVTNFLTLLWYNPTLDTDCPRWVYASWALGLFLYQTFDACDGTQARRTGQSGPLGELFDHGVDALNTSLGVIIFAGAVNLGYSWATVLAAFGSLAAFYLTTWEEYHTGTLYLGIVSGPVEGVLTLAAVYAWTAVKGGGSYWQQPMLKTLGIDDSWLPESLRGMSWAHTYLAYGGLMLSFNVISSCISVYRTRRSQNRSPWPALAGLLPFFLPWLFIPLWLHLRPILFDHLIPFLLFIGIASAYQVGLIITAHLVRAPYPYTNVLFIPMIFGIFDALAPSIVPGWKSALGDGHYVVAYMFMCLGVCFGVHGSFIVDVVMNICEYLDIWCLTIKYRRDLGVMPPGEKKEL